MSLMNNLQSILGQNLSELGRNPSFGGLGSLLGGKSSAGMLGPAAIGGILGALLSSGTARNIAGGALLFGGGAALWNKFKERTREADTLSAQPRYGKIPQSAGSSSAAPADDRASRLLRALVFAAKSDGHIDEQEQNAIYGKIQELNIGAAAQNLINQAMAEPLDPVRIAAGVGSEEEALELFTVSCAVINVDHFMERSYLDALGKALHIPEDVQAEIEATMTGGKR